MLRIVNGIPPAPPKVYHKVGDREGEYQHSTRRVSYCLNPCELHIGVMQENHYRFVHKYQKAQKINYLSDDELQCSAIFHAFLCVVFITVFNIGETPADI